MNKARSKQVDSALQIIARAIGEITQAAAQIEEIRDEMDSQFQEMSEKAQEGDRGQELSEEVSQLSEIIEAIQSVDYAKEIGEAAEELGFAIDGLPTAKLSKQKVADNRISRLPKWARDEIARATADKEAAEKMVAENFTDPTGAPEEFTVWKHAIGKLAGKVIPARMIEANVNGLRIEIVKMPKEHIDDKERYGLSINAQRGLKIHPVASNIITVTGEAW